MNDQSILYPPNFQGLNENVIRNVVPNVTKCSNTVGNVFVGTCDESHQTSSKSSNGVRLPGAHAPVRFAPQGLPNDMSAGVTVEPPTSSLDKGLCPNRIISNACLRETLDDSCNSPRLTTEQQNVVTSSVVDAAKLAFRRRRGREHQARHRHKKLRGLQHLEDSLETLQQEIHRLNLQKQITSHYLSINSTALGIVVEYFRLFRFGVLQDTPTSKFAGSEAMVQQSFLKTAMVPDLTDGTVVGLPAILETWKFMSQCLQNIDMQPVRITNGSGGVLIATAKCRFTITEKTLRLAFPHLTDDDSGGILVEKLLGRELTMNDTIKFKYDDQSGRITSMLSKPDMLTPLLRLLGSLEDVSRMFENAIITPECTLVMSRVFSC